MPDWRALRNDLRFRNFVFHADENAEAFAVVLSTDAAVNVGGFEEVLSHAPGACDLSRAPLPLLDEHGTDHAAFGAVDELRLISGRLVGTLRLDRSARAVQLVDSMRSGGPQALSIGFTVLAFHPEGSRFVIDRWQPFEVSIVKEPADVGAGIFLREEEMNEAGIQVERERASGIARAGRRYGAESAAADAIERGDALSDFRQRAILQSVTRPATIGMSRSECARYSIAAAIGGLMNPMRGSSLEREIHNELARIHGQPETDAQIFLPADVFQEFARRDLTVASAAGGGYLVDTDGHSAGFVELVRPRSVALTLGAETLEGVVGSLTVPRVAAGASITWHTNESTAPAEGGMTLGQIALSPKTASANLEFSRQLLLQTTPGGNRLIAQDLLRAMGTAVDQAVLNGSGASGQPSGLMSAPGIGSVTGASLALDDVLEFQSDVGDNLGPQCAFATTRAVAALLAQRQKASGTSSFLWEGSLFEGQLCGVRAMTSGNTPSGTIIFGDWPAILIASWGTLVVELNPFSNFPAGIVGARVMHSLDLGVRRVAAFSVATAVT
jgi:HK97 family phage major capsid protein